MTKNSFGRLLGVASLATLGLACVRANAADPRIVTVVVSASGERCKVETLHINCVHAGKTLRDSLRVPVATNVEVIPPGSGDAAMARARKVADVVGGFGYVNVVVSATPRRIEAH